MRRPLGGGGIPCRVGAAAVVVLALGWLAMLVAGSPRASLESPRLASARTVGGINVEPSARPWHYLGANPDGWWCPSASTCTNGTNPLARIDTELSWARQLHVANVRIEIPWFLVEPGRNQYDWSRADYIFASAAARGVQLQPILVYTPSWESGGYNAFPPAADFGSFVSAFMARYGGRIAAVEMWNEPDGGQSLASNDVGQYVKDILVPGYNAVKQSSYVGVQVIEGGSINDAGGTPNWLSGIYAAGGGNSFDIAAFHDYGGNYSTVVNAYQGVLNQHGQGGKPVWMGEYGQSDSNGSLQSSLINSAMTTPGLAMAQFYTLRDEGVYTCCPPASTGENQKYGVMTTTYSPKSSFTTMMNAYSGQPVSPVPPPTSGPTPPPGGGPGGSSGSSSSSTTATHTAAPTPRPVPTPTPTPTLTPTPTPTPTATPTGSPAVAQGGPSGTPGSTARTPSPSVTRELSTAPSSSRRWLIAGGAAVVLFAAAVGGLVPFLLRRRTA